ncbi:ATP12-domain-containing protein [Hyphopichia burtonii NRRL Y-1933]|uniref:ATP12-domain-containing protein n=1 Tax=Hyphopichia burtonii NRRL Y-1933 TaxID=984485 RepID=A0A1E4RDN2_9ASCO|nr:ATP12-domain-containing protein [Hyphopichia burtonii NRRL Y-1933]ODV65379.1 ATP12-domain-containing protein [Hyphopichia burtonii NRRL Y-1933]
MLRFGRVGGIPRVFNVTVRSFVYTSRVLATDGSMNAFIPKMKTPGELSFVENNIPSETNRLSKSMTKFWETVDTEYNETTKQYDVKLDGKTLKTPLGFPLSLPESKKEMAYLIGHEWANLPDLKIKTNSLPLTSITARAIDLMSINKDGEPNNELISKVGKLEDIKLNLLRYFDTDTCLIFTTLEEYDGKLRSRQNELYLPLIEEFEDFFTKYAQSNEPQKLLPSSDYKVKLNYLDCETDGLRGNTQAITTQNIVLHWLNQLPIYDLVALEKAILTSKSFLCGISLLRSNAANPDNVKNLYQVNKSHPNSHYFKSIDEIIELGNLESIFQTEEWGEVEDTHDVDKADWSRNLSSAALLCH